MSLPTAAILGDIPSEVEEQEKLTKSLVAALRTVLDTGCSLTVDEVKTAPWPPEGQIGTVSTVIGLPGRPLNGTLAIQFSDSLLCGAVGTLLGEEYEAVGDDVRDGAGELTNQITGVFKRSLDGNYQFDMATPIIISGEDGTLRVKEHQITVGVSCVTALGEVRLYLLVNRV